MNDMHKSLTNAVKDLAAIRMKVTLRAMDILNVPMIALCNSVKDASSKINFASKAISKKCRKRIERDW